ncbi:MAG: hypothetical protein Q7J78_07845 [Clostridiales bacterium]|nr:hypothetical protein [Clostridiales bacterium]
MGTVLLSKTWCDTDMGKTATWETQTWGRFSCLLRQENRPHVYP